MSSDMEEMSTVSDKQMEANIEDALTFAKRMADAYEGTEKGARFGRVIDAIYWLKATRDRDELLRQIGEKVVERFREKAKDEFPTCPTCGQWYEDENLTGGFHTDDCPLAEFLTRYLEATDGG